MATTGSDVNTLRRPTIEFFRRSDYNVSRVVCKRINLAFMLGVRGKGRLEAAIRTLPVDVRQAYVAEGEYLLALQALLAGEPSSVVVQRFEAAIAMAPERGHIQHHICGHYLQTADDLVAAGNRGRAAYYARKAVAVWPNGWEASYALGSILASAGRMQDAAQHYETAVLLNPGLSALRCRLADHYTRNGQLHVAARHLREVLGRDQDNVDALCKLGKILAEQARYAEALPYLKRAHELAGDSPDVIDSYAWVLFRSGNHDAARRVIRETGDYHRGREKLAKRRTVMMDN